MFLAFALTIYQACMQWSKKAVQYMLPLQHVFLSIMGKTVIFSPKQPPLIYGSNLANHC